MHAGCVRPAVHAQAHDPAVAGQVRLHPMLAAGSLVSALEMESPAGDLRGCEPVAQ
jgi:hypothetical protein